MSEGRDIKGLLARFCADKPVARLEIFGSQARGTAGEASDLDLLVTYGPGMATGLSYFESVSGMKNQLESLLDCSVDLVDRATVEQTLNPILRNSILSGSRLLYECAH